MRIIPTFIHGIVDYVASIVFFFLPNLCGFADGPSWAVLVPRVMAVLGLLYSLSTNYELGFLKIISMRVHLAIDYFIALVFLASPFLFGFINGPNNQWEPFIAIGVFVFVIATLTKTHPSHGAATARA